MKLHLWSGLDIICWGVCALQHHKVFSTGHCWVHICSCCRIFIPFWVKLEDTLLCIFCIIGSMFGTSDIHPVDRPCLTLHARWFLEMCNHGLEDCFLLSRGENDELVQGKGGWGGGGWCIRCQFHQDYSPHMFSFIVYGVWSKYCKRLWWFSPLIDGVLWGSTQHIICFQDELALSQHRQGTRGFLWTLHTIWFIM